MDLRVTKRRSARQLAGRKRSVYYESDTDDEDVSLLGDEHDDGTPARDASSAQPAVVPPPKPRKKARRGAKPQTRSRAPQSQRARLKRSEKGVSRPFGSFRKKKRRGEDRLVSSSIASDNVVPAWGSLPVELLREIFLYASQNLHEQTTSGSAAATWLLRSARHIGRDFAIPALEAYYVSPAFHTVMQPHHLLELVQIPPDESYIKYKLKIKRLEINVKHLAYTAQHRPLFNLSALARELPQLQQLEVVHPTDNPPYRDLKIQSWYYPADLFDVMDESNIRLRTWRWSRDMLRYEDSEVMYAVMSRIHGQQCLEHLERLIVCGFDFNDSAEPPEPADTTQPHPATLASCICALPNLKDLTFSSCDVIMEDFLLRLPPALERLELTNCLEITAEMITTYLTTNGSNLRELVLNSNAALSLSFLPCLKTACPKLDTLVVNTIYYSEKTNYNDAYALYDHLMTAEDIPTWPSTLRHLEFSNLQKLDAPAASTLFQSLLDAAPELPDLRQLIVQAHIDIAWRDRADFRDNWVDRLRATFFHKTAPPLPHLCSLRRYREWKEERSLPPLQPEDAATVHRRLSHVRITPREPPLDHLPTSDDEDEPVAATSRRVQPRRSARIVESQSAASQTGTPTPESAEEEQDEDPAFVQGLCELVDIRIDNQRPRETQYTEANFIDSEESGDEDWQEGAAEMSDDGYAW